MFFIIYNIIYVYQHSNPRLSTIFPMASIFFMTDRSTIFVRFYQTILEALNLLLSPPAFCKIWMNVLAWAKSCVRHVNSYCLMNPFWSGYLAMLCKVMRFDNVAIMSSVWMIFVNMLFGTTVRSTEKNIIRWFN